MQGAIDELEARGIAHEFEVRSAHPQPDAVAEYGRTARERGLRVRHTEQLQSISVRTLAILRYLPILAGSRRTT